MKSKTYVLCLVALIVASIACLNGGEEATEPPQPPEPVATQPPPTAVPTEIPTQEPTQPPPTDEPAAPTSPPPQATDTLFTLPANMPRITVNTMSQLELLAHLPNDEVVFETVISPSSRRLAYITWDLSSDTFTNRMWDLYSGEMLVDFQHPYYSPPTFRDDDTIVVYDLSSDDKFAYWDSWKQTNATVLVDLDDDAQALAVSPLTQSIIAVTYEHDGTSTRMALYRIVSGAEYYSIRLDGEAWADELIVFSPDETMISVTSSVINEDGNSVYVTTVRDTSNGDLLNTFYGLAWFVFSPDSEMLAGTLDTGEGLQVQIFDTETWERIETIGIGRNINIYYPTFSPDSRILMILFDREGDHRNRAWDTFTWDEISIPVDIHGNAIFSPDGRLIVSFPDWRSIEVYGILP